MKRQRRTFSFEFKKMIVDQADTGEFSLNQIARDHDIAPGLVTSWRKQIQAGVLVKGPSLRERQLEIELEKSRAKVGELTMIIDAFKKAREQIELQRRLNSSVISPRTYAQSVVPMK